jgi:phage tail-like protein
MATRDAPFGAYNFLVDLSDGTDNSQTIGGFSDVSGLGTEMTMMEYRNGNEKNNRVRKVPGLHKAADATFKRGIVGSKSFWEWIKATRTSSATQRNLTVTLLDEQRNPVMVWRLLNARPMKWTGPTLAAKSSSDVAMEELVVASEGFEFGS